MTLYAKAHTAANFPLIGNPNRHYYPTRRGSILGIVLHVTAGLQDLDSVGVDHSAAGTNRYGATTDTVASWHVCTDSDSIEPALPPSYTAFHVKGYNSRTFGVEICNADARWDNKPAAWVEATLRNAATACAPIVAENRLPIRLATKAEVDATIATGRPFGFTYHAWLQSDRRDPGADFPFAQFASHLTAPDTPKDGFDMAEISDLEQVITERAGAAVLGTRIGRTEVAPGKPLTVGIALDRLYAAAAADRAQITALTAAVRALAESGGGDADAVVQAIRDELANFQITLTATKEPSDA